MRVVSAASYVWSNTVGAASTVAGSRVQMCKQYLFGFIRASRSASRSVRSASPSRDDRMRRRYVRCVSRLACRFPSLMVQSISLWVLRGSGSWLGIWD